MTTQTHLRLWLYVGIAIMPGVIDFFKNSSDYSFRGLAVMLSTAVFTGLVTARAYIDQSKSRNENESTTPPVGS